MSLLGLAPSFFILRVHTPVQTPREPKKFHFSLIFAAFTMKAKKNGQDTKTTGPTQTSNKKQNWIGTPESLR
jgi:hypothetical protein